ncbi:MAG: VOC family protein [Pseudomonadota bacterium]
MKLHISVQVDDLEQATRFYSALFNCAPAISREGYVKWDVENPAINFVAETVRNRSGVDHLGIQVDDAEELQALSDRMQSTGHPFLGIERGVCCFADIEKSWVKGPADDKWEAFLTHSHDEENYGSDREHLLDTEEAGDSTGCCSP